MSNSTKKYVFIDRFYRNEVAFAADSEEEARVKYAGVFGQYPGKLVRTL